MPGTTPVYGITYPEPTDKVADGAAAIQSTAETVETALVAAVASTADKVGYALADAKGDLIVATGPDAFVRLPVGASGNVLAVDPAQAAGVKWAAPAAGGGGASSLYVPAGAFHTVSGTPAVTAAGYMAALALDASAIEEVAAGAAVDTSWATYDAWVVWVNVAAGAGSVAWTLYTQALDDGVASNGPQQTTHGPVAAAAGGQNVVKRTRVAQNATATGLRNLMVQRRATDAGDTLANDAGLLGLLLQKVT